MVPVPVPPVDSGIRTLMLILFSFVGGLETSDPTLKMRITLSLWRLSVLKKTCSLMLVTPLPVGLFECDDAVWYLKELLPTCYRWPLVRWNDSDILQLKCESI